MSTDPAPGAPAELSPEDRALLRRYCTTVDGPVFCLHNLPEEVIAVLFAYYSRSEGTLRDNLLRLLRSEELLAGSEAPSSSDPDALAHSREKARAFHERWVVGYGHASVAEHAVAHVALEDVSILASKAVEDSRLASYTEKSTRYVEFQRRYHMDESLPPPARALYRNTVEGLFEAYSRLLPRVTDQVMATTDAGRFKTERGFRSSCRAQACDVLRYLLPAATHTNIGLTANARTLEMMISRLLSHPLAECRLLGERLREQVTLVIPTLLKYARPSAYRTETPPAMREEALRCLPPSEPPPEPPLVRLIPPAVSPEEVECLLAAAVLYEAAEQPYERVLSRVRALPPEERRAPIRRYLAGRRSYGTVEHGYQDPPLRALEQLFFSFEIVVDYGAYRDIQRHRMGTQLTQRLDCSLGYETPPLLAEGPHAREYAACMARAAEAHACLAAEHPEEAQYVIPLAYRKRLLFTWNLRALHHFISLRSARQGHVSYRRVAREVFCELQRWSPFLAEFIRVDMNDYDLARPG